MRASCFSKATQAGERRIFDRVDPFLKDDLLRGMFRTSGWPASADAPSSRGRLRYKSELCHSRKRKATARRLRRRSSLAASRARTRSRTASWAASGVHTPVSSPARMQPRQRNRISPVRLRDPLARPFRDQEPERPPCIRGRALGFADKARIPSARLQNNSIQPIVSARQSLDRSLDRQRAVLDVAENPDFSTSRPLPRSRLRASSWRRRKPRRLRYTFQRLMRPPCARLNARRHTCEQPLVLICTKGRATSYGF